MFEVIGVVAVCGLFVILLYFAIPRMGYNDEIIEKILNGNREPQWVWERIKEDKK